MNSDYEKNYNNSSSGLHYSTTYWYTLGIPSVYPWYTIICFVRYVCRSDWYV